jgi:voltage-gated potassium channel
MTNCQFLNNVIAWLKNLGCQFRQQKTAAYGLFVAFAATLLFGFAVYAVDPNVHSLWDGVWYAWVTMTHVGYGDIVPVSFAGRILAAILILLGLGILAFLTATFSALMISHDVSAVQHEESKILAELERLHRRIDELDEKLKPASRSRRSTES